MREASAELDDLEHAEELVLQLDTRASELKVDGFKALVRENPDEQLAELADDIATPEELLAELGRDRADRRAPRPPSPTWQESYGAYTDAITRLRRRRGRRPGRHAGVRWEDIQAANDLTDGAVGAAKDALARGHDWRRGASCDERSTRSQTISLIDRAGRPRSGHRGASAG